MTHVHPSPHHLSLFLIYKLHSSSFHSTQKKKKKNGEVFDLSSPCLPLVGVIGILSECLLATIPWLLAKLQGWLPELLQRV